MGFICAVCRKTLSAGSELSLAPCGHISHHQCWVQKSNSLCPKCGRTFWRDYLKKVYLEEDGNTEQSQDRIDTGETNSSVGTEIVKLREEIQSLRSAIHGNGLLTHQEGTILKTEPRDDDQGMDPFSTIIYTDYDWNSVGENLSGKDRQKKVCKNAGQLVVSALPSSATCLLSRDLFCGKIADSINKFTEHNIDGYDILLSIKRSDKQLFRFDLDLSAPTINDGDTSVAKKQKLQIEFSLKMDEKSSVTKYTE